MDPVSLATAVITIGGLVITAANFARSLDEAGRFDKDIKKIWRSFNVFAPLIESVSMTLDELCREHPESDVVRYAADTGLASGLAEISRDIRDQIRVIRTQFEGAAEGGFLGKLWWTLMHKPEIVKLYPEMDSLKLSLLLVQNNIQYNTTHDVQKKKRLRQAMRQLETTLITLREEHLSAEQKFTIGASHPARSVTSLALDTNKLLLELSRSMRRTERVPEIIPMSAPRTRTARRYRRRPDSVIHMEDMVTRERPLIDPQPPPQQLRRTKPGSTHIWEEVSLRPQPHVVIPESALQRYEAEPVEEHQRDGTEVHRDSMASAHSTIVTRASSSSTARTGPDTPITPLTPGPAESSFTDVRESRNYHSLLGLEWETVQGYIRAPSSARGLLKSVTAQRFGTRLGENFIIVHKAKELGLDISPLDPEAHGGDMVLEVTEGQRLPVIGTVDTTWSTLYPSGFKMMMWVLDGQPDGITIVLGRPFEKRRRHYNRAPSVSERS